MRLDNLSHQWQWRMVQKPEKSRTTILDPKHELKKPSLNAQHSTLYLATEFPKRIRINDPWMTTSSSSMYVLCKCSGIDSRTYPAGVSPGHGPFLLRQAPSLNGPAQDSPVWPDLSQSRVRASSKGNENELPEPSVSRQGATPALYCVSYWVRELRKSLDIRSRLRS